MNVAAVQAAPAPICLRKAPATRGEAPSRWQIILQGKKDSSLSCLMPVHLWSSVNPSVCCFVRSLGDSPSRPPQRRSREPHPGTASPRVRGSPATSRQPQHLPRNLVRGAMLTPAPTCPTFAISLPRGGRGPAERGRPITGRGYFPLLPMLASYQIRL